MYRDGKGLFPLPLKGPAELPIDRLETAPDVQVDKHFIFRIFAERRNTFLQTVLVQRYFAVPDEWKPPADSSVRVIAQASQWRTAGGGTDFRQRPGGGVFNHGRAGVEQLGAKPEFRGSPARLASVPFATNREKILRAWLASHLELTLDPAKYQAQVRFTSPQETAAAFGYDRCSAKC